MPWIVGFLWLGLLCSCGEKKSVVVTPNRPPPVQVSPPGPSEPKDSPRIQNFQKKLSPETNGAAKYFLQMSWNLAPTDLTALAVWIDTENSLRVIALSHSRDPNWRFDTDPMEIKDKGKRTTVEIRVQDDATLEAILEPSMERYKKARAGAELLKTLTFDFK